MPHTLVKLRAKRDVARLQRLLERCSDYYELHEGWPTPADAGEYELTWDRSAVPSSGLCVLAFEEDGTDALDAAVQIYNDCPEPGMWWIGLLIVAPELRSRGLGSDLVRFTLEEAADAGAGTIKLAVSVNNPRALRFWTNAGFRECEKGRSVRARSGHVEETEILVRESGEAISDDELNAMAARAVATTPGPWKPYFEGRDHYAGDSFIQTATQDLYIHAEDYMGGGGHFQPDLDFIAYARQDIPRLIAEIRRLRSLEKK